MKVYKITLLILLCLCSNSCFTGADGDSKTIIDNYYVAGDYGYKNVHLGFEDQYYGGIGLIEKPITSIANNDNFIIVKRESDSIEFYILKVVQSGDYSTAEENIIGPLSKKEFEIEKSTLKLDHLKWNEKFDH